MQLTLKHAYKLFCIAFILGTVLVGTSLFTRLNPTYAEVFTPHQTARVNSCNGSPYHSTVILDDSGKTVGKLTVYYSAACNLEWSVTQSYIGTQSIYAYIDNFSTNDFAGTTGTSVQTYQITKLRSNYAEGGVGYWYSSISFG